MKRSLLLLTLTVCLSFAAQAQKEKRVYSFCYAYSVKYKALYVTPILTAIENSKHLKNPLYNALELQWMRKVSTIDPNYYEFEKSVYPGGSYDNMDEYRSQTISRFRTDGYTVYDVYDFHYHQERKDE